MGVKVSGETTLLVNGIIAGVALFLIAVILVVILIRAKKQGTESLKGHDRSFWVREVAIFVASILIPVLCIFIHFELVPTIFLCGCGVIASWVGMQELFPKKKD